MRNPESRLRHLETRKAGGGQVVIEIAYVHEVPKSFTGERQATPGPSAKRIGVMTVYLSEDDLKL